MSARTFDVAIIGGGHNALVAAAYLARAGRTVVVLERSSVVGGTAVTEEFAPGFRCSTCFPSAELLHPDIVREMELLRHGLALLPTEGGVFVPATDGDHLFIPGPDGSRKRYSWHLSPQIAARQISRLSEDDARAFVTFDRFLKKLADALEPLLVKPLPDLEPNDVGGALALFNIGLHLRGLGTADLGEALRFLPMPIADVLEERFASQLVKAAIAGGALTATWLGPLSPGSAYALLHHRSGANRGALVAPRFVRGGMGTLARALASAAREAGAEIRTEAEVQSIAVRNGEARGAQLVSGEEIEAAVVVSGLDPRRTLLDLLGADHLEPEMVWAARNIRCRGNVGIVHFALETLPAFSTRPHGIRHLTGRIQLGATVEEMERAFDDGKYGRVPERPTIEITIPSLTDPSLAPDGKHVMQAWVQHVPYHLAQGDWKTQADMLAERVTRTISDYAPGFTERIRERRVLTPKDLEERFGLTEGCLYHAELALDQLFYLRPLPGWGQHRLPIPNVYLCGPGSHPGGGISGLPGRNAAQKICADWQAGRIP